MPILIFVSNFWRNAASPKKKADCSPRQTKVDYISGEPILHQKRDCLYQCAWVTRGKRNMKEYELAGRNNSYLILDMRKCLYIA